jgi:hypothetical protein
VRLVTTDDIAGPQLRNQTVKLALKFGDAGCRTLCLVDGAPANRIRWTALFVKAVAALTTFAAVGTDDASAFSFEAVCASKSIRS